MSYTALYRKWRPAGFDDVKGQDHIVAALKNQIISGRIGHAYLFTGTRGTGKTSVAKILAKAVNCEHPINGSPCHTCATCKAIAAGASLNVSEIDAASNNGVDNIREIREEVQYRPAEGKYRVYIIDEVHMLSTGAFNALLKTLEEPPAYVIFILATTEVHKIPITVLSRCQRYDFRRIEGETIVERLSEMALGEDIDVTDQALRYIARKGDGSMRDSISLFDQCIAFYYGEQLTYEKVLDVLGAVDNEVFHSFFDNLLSGNTAACIEAVDDLLLQGRELGQFVTDFIWYLRNLLLVMTSDVTADTLDMTEDGLTQLKFQAGQLDMNQLMRYIRVLSELSNQMRYASSKRVLLELAIIRLAHPEMEQTTDAVLQRLNTLETQLKQGTFVMGASAQSGVPGTEALPGGDNGFMTSPADSGNFAGSVNPGMAVSPGTSSAGAPAQTPGNSAPTIPGIAPNGAPLPQKIVVLPKSTLEDFRRIKDNWSQILRGLGGIARAVLDNARPEYIGEGQIQLLFTDALQYDAFLQGEDKIALLHNFVADNYQIDVTFMARLAKANEPVVEYLSKEELGAKFNIDIIFENS
ncbi:MAG: DNA polymerase III subunit gamma/tau [Lachnospiraceae bacterium]|nr:DNA polymerase III subunit gamma/tau [Lachnospiraceae bacterium]